MIVMTSTITMLIIVMMSMLMIVMMLMLITRTITIVMIDSDDVPMCGQGLFAAISLLPLSEFQDNRLVFTSQLNDDDQD